MSERRGGGKVVSHLTTLQPLLFKKCFWLKSKIDMSMGVRRGGARGALVPPGRPKIVILDFFGKNCIFFVVFLGKK